MKKYFIHVMAVIALIMALPACNQNKSNDPTDPGTNPDKPSETKLFTPEESKDKLMSVANRMVGTFNTDDQKAAIELADGIYEKYRDYNFDEFEKQADKYDELFRKTAHYVRGVLRGDNTPVSAEVITFSFENESVIFEADEANHTWKNLGKAGDNSIILRCTDKNGTPCEAKFWGEGSSKTYEYTYEEYHWETPTPYVDNSEIEYVRAYINGEGYYLYHDDYGRWYYTTWDDYTGDEETIYVTLSECDEVYSYHNMYGSLYYDRERDQFYYYDWENEHKVSDGWRTIRGIIPAKIMFTLKQGSNEIIRFELAQDLVKNDHANLSVSVKVTNLSWTADIKIGSTNGSFAFDFKYDSERVLGVAASLPSYKLIDKADDMSYEDWIHQYEERYEELIKSVGEANGLVDIMGEVQVKAKIHNFGYAYRDFRKQEGFDNYSRPSVEKFCQLINDNQTNGIYYNSDLKQAEVRVQVTGDDYGRFYPEGVLFFPSDSTTYAFEQYFVRKPFTDLQYAVEDLVNAYIRLSPHLYGEVGEISFDGNPSYNNHPDPVGPQDY